MAGLPSGQVLDMVLDAPVMNNVCYELQEILAALGLNPCMKTFDVVAKDLSRLAHKSPPWTKKYIHSVYHGKIEPSPLLTRTIEALAQVADGTPFGVAGAVYIKALAQSDIPDGILIPANAKAVKCARPGCPVWFIRVHPRQIYHDKSCGKAYEKGRSAPP